jgi:23S rRNA (adenine2503-C2)-methyltransferase
VHGVVFQGMGEPMANLDRVLEAIAVLKEPCGLAIDARNITGVHLGLPHGIRAARARGAQGAARAVHRQRAPGESVSA